MRPCANGNILGRYFNPRSPHGERLPALVRRYIRHLISTHAPRTGSDQGVFTRIKPDMAISTHAPRTGSDVHARCANASPLISTHAPRTGSDSKMRVMHFLTLTFQPTLPARGATLQPRTSDAPRGFQPTLPARGATHTPHLTVRRWLFQPTLPARGATPARLPKNVSRLISTHAPRTGSDGRTASTRRTPSYFNPRSPHGERPPSPRCRTWASRFQPTLPARGATSRARAAA